MIVPKSLRQQILKECHDVPFTGHVGMRKTLELVDRQFHWRGLRGDTIQYVKTCPTCQVMKSDNRAKAGLLQLLEIPSKKWAHVTTDLVTDLPESNGFTAIIVFVDKLSKMVHLAGCRKEVTAMEYAQISSTTSFGYTVSQRSLYLTGIHASPASSGDHCLTCSVWIFGSVLRFIHRDIDSQSRCSKRWTIS